MKNLKAIAMSMFLAMSFIPAAWATEAPAACPAIELIKKGGLSGVQEDKEDKLFITYQISKYNTSSTWGFVIAVPSDQATSKGDAMNKARQALVTLSGEPEPVAMDDSNKQWYCLYQDQMDYLAVSFTPLSVSNETVHSIFTLPGLKMKK